jgi:predicted  nucleic acid-binding Zn-ribbon protein
VDLAPREQPLNAAAETQLRLLELQDRDTRLNQLAHKVKTLPEAARLAEVEVRLSRLRDGVVAAETIASDLEYEQEKADQDVEQVRERTRRDQQLLDSGSIGDPKQLQSLQSELQSLARRQAELEDVELEVMERVEGANAAVAQLRGERDTVAAERGELAAQVEALLADIGAERATVESERTTIAASIPADLLGLYDKIRADHGGVGAAPLHRGRCEGCRMELPPNEIEAIREAPADSVIRCEECRRILVRTPESGL